MQVSSRSNGPGAVVLGLNTHGLAVARALATNGVHVLALTPFAESPANRTRYADVRLVPDLDSGRLPEILLETASAFVDARPVLFPTSDRMVRLIAENWAELSESYSLSWQDCRSTVLELQSKDQLAAISRRTGLLHPVSAVVDSAASFDFETLKPGRSYIAKPARPQGGFKTRRIENAGELRSLVEQYPSDLPFVVQDFIEGPISALRFCNLFCADGKILAAFCGRKLRAFPTDAGQGTVMESFPDQRLMDIAQIFVAELGFTGPVSLEFKLDPAGDYWLIEPNPGRTEFCADLAIQAGVNLPMIEWQFCQPGTLVPDTSAERHVVWFDTVNDPASIMTAWRYSWRALLGKTRLAFPFLGHKDPHTVLQSIKRNARRLQRRLMP